MLIVLTRHELVMCRWVGKQRYRHARRWALNAGRGPSAGWSGSHLHERGACAEYAVSLALNLSWRPSIGQTDQPDVGGFVEVRSTIKPDGSLFIKPKDAGPFVLVAVEPPDRFHLLGWMDAAYAKVNVGLVTGRYDDGHPVPRSALWPLATLVSTMAGPEWRRAA